MIFHHLNIGLFITDNVALAADLDSCTFLVSRHHDHFGSCLFEAKESLRDSLSRGIMERDHADKSESFKREIPSFDLKVIILCIS